MHSHGGKVYAVGSAGSILPFRAGGVVLYPVSDAEGVARALREIASQPPGSLVLITEEAAAGCVAELKDFEARGRHAFLIVPTREKEKSLALEEMRSAIIRSVGVDLLARSQAPETGPEIVFEERNDERS